MLEASGWTVSHLSVHFRSWSAVKGESDFWRKLGYLLVSSFPSLSTGSCMVEQSFSHTGVTKREKFMVLSLTAFLGDADSALGQTVQEDSCGSNTGCAIV